MNAADKKRRDDLNERRKSGEMVRYTPHTTEWQAKWLDLKKQIDNLEEELTYFVEAPK